MFRQPLWHEAVSRFNERGKPPPKPLSRGGDDPQGSAPHAKHGRQVFTEP